MHTGVRAGRPGRGSGLAVAALWLSALPASCNLQQQSTLCDVACFGGPNDVTFSPGLTQPGQYTINATVSGKPASCSFSLPCSPGQQVCAGSIAASCDFTAGVSAVTLASGAGSAAEVTVTVSKGGAALATQSFKDEPEFGLNNSCGCPGSGRVMQVQLLAELLEIGGADHGGAGRDEGPIKQQL